MKKQRESQTALERYDREVNKINAGQGRPIGAKSQMNHTQESQTQTRQARRSSMGSVAGSKGQPFRNFCANLENSKGMTTSHLHTVDD
jgi:hypothetical protein